MKKSIEFVHGEVNDLKEENKIRKEKETLTNNRIDQLEELNATLKDRVIDLQARSMRDNLIFYNISEKKDENVKEIIHNMLEKQLGLEKAKENFKIDRAHRLGKNIRSSKPRAIVSKFNYYPDKEQILANARKLKGTGIAVSEQFPDEIMKVRKRLYPVLKKAKQEGRRTNFSMMINFMLNHKHQISSSL